MAEAVNLGTYHDLFFKLGGTDKTADEFAALTDQKEIDRIKEVYASWVAKYINVDEKNPPEEGLPNDMVDRIAADPAFGLTREEIVAGLVPENFVGRAPQQVEEFIANVLQPIFDADPEDVEQHASLSV